MKKIQVVFKSGKCIYVTYGFKAFNELIENMGKDHKVVYKDFSIMCKEVVAVNFIPADASVPAEAE